MLGAAEFLGRELRNPFQCGMDQLRPRLELGDRRYWRLAVPWADILTDIAAEQVMAHSGPQALWNSASFFDGQI